MPYVETGPKTWIGTIVSVDPPVLWVDGGRHRLVLSVGCDVRPFLNKPVQVVGVEHHGAIHFATVEEALP